MMRNLRSLLLVLLLAAPCFGDYTGWSYKRALTDGNSTSVTAFQVKVALTTSNFDFSHVEAGGTSIRFWDATSSAALPYWIESWDDTGGSESAVVWVKVTDMTHSHEMYYGKADATSESSLANTFELADTFEAAGSFTSPLPNAASAQTTPTYDSSGETVHPSVIDFGASTWGGYRYWMAHTPYPAANDDYENPSLLASSDGSTWTLPGNMPDPIDAMPAGGHNADANLVYDPESDKLWVYYGNYTASNYFAVRTVTYNGPGDYTVSGETTVLSHDVGKSWVSPAVVKMGTGDWRMWYYNSTDGTLEYRTSTDGLTWSAASTCTVSPSVDLWHLEVMWVSGDSAFWMNALQSNKDGLFLWRSTDATTWTRYLYPYINAAASGWDGGQLYKSGWSYVPATDTLRLWYNGVSAGNAWRVGYSSGDASELFLAAQGRSTLKWSFTVGDLAFWTQSTTQVKRGTYSAQFLQDSSVTHTALHGVAADDRYYEVDLYDDGDATALALLRLGIYRESTGAISANRSVGWYTNTSTTHYVYQNSSYTAGSVARSNGWHKFGLRLKGSDETMKWYVDDTEIASADIAADNQYAIQAQIVGLKDYPTTFYADDFRVRKFADTEPSITVGEEQELETGIASTIRLGDTGIYALGSTARIGLGD